MCTKFILWWNSVDFFGCRIDIFGSSFHLRLPVGLHLYLKKTMQQCFSPLNGPALSPSYLYSGQTKSGVAIHQASHLIDCKLKSQLRHIASWNFYSHYFHVRFLLNVTLNATKKKKKKKSWVRKEALAFLFFTANGETWSLSLVLIFEVSKMFSPIKQHCKCLTISVSYIKCLKCFWVERGHFSKLIPYRKYKRHKSYRKFNLNF